MTLTAADCWAEWERRTDIAPSALCPELITQMLGQRLRAFGFAETVTAVYVSGIRYNSTGDVLYVPIAVRSDCSTTHYTAMTKSPNNGFARIWPQLV